MADMSTVASAERQEAVANLKLSRKAKQKARHSAWRTQRRAREKEERQEKERIRAEKRAAGELDDDDDLDEDDGRQKKKIKLDCGRVVIDLGFDNEMTDKVCF
jgi:tRNA (guanine9-N1)-methyltransferase